MVQFTKLRLSGFKSFLHPTEIEIGPGKTGVVGPNGCGKSNLLEALSWVMGETSAKRMRGDGMEDVIFNGTNNKSARISAQVTLTLDNTNKTAPPPYHDVPELEITRKIERGTGSDYTINGKSVRAKDVQLLFADLVSGANSPALVSQGRITSIIQAKPKDRRRILEDAAGISGLHARRHESELKLRGTENNLERLNDIITTQESSLTSLKKQARQASRYRNLSDHIKKAEANLFIFKWEQAQATQKEFKTQFDEVELTIRAKMAEITALSTKHAEATALLPNLRQEEAKAAALLQRLLIEQENLETLIQRQKDDLTRAQKEQATTRQELDQEKSNKQEIKESVQSLEEESTNLEENLKTHKDTLEAIIAQRDLLKTQADEIQNDYLALNQTIISAETEINSLQNQKIALEGQIASLSEEKKKYSERLEQVKAKQEQQTLFDGLKTDIAHSEEETATLKEKREVLEADKEVLEQNLQTQRALRNEKESEHTRIKAEYDALTQILNNSQNGDKNHPPLLDQISAQDGYETALGAALGEGLSYPLIEEALIYWSHLGQDALTQELDMNITSLHEFVEAPTNLNRALSQIGFVETQEQGLTLSNKLKAGQILVSKKGDVWRWDGLVIKADAPSPAAVKLQQKNRLIELEQLVLKAENALSLENEKVSSAKNKVETINLSLQENRSSLYKKEEFLSQQRKRLGSLEKEYHALQNDLTSIETSLNRIEEDFTKTNEQLTHVKDSLALKKDISNQKSRRDSLKEKRDTLTSDYNSEQNAYNEALRQKDRMEMRSDQLQKDILSLQNHDKSIEQRITVLTERLDQATNALNTLLSKNEKPEEDSDLEQKIHHAEHNRNKKAEELLEAESIVQTLALSLREKETHLSSIKEQRAGLQASYSNSVQKQEELEQNALEIFELSPQQIATEFNLDLEELTTTNFDQLNNRLTRLKNERDTMGPVNLRADIEAEEVEADILRLRAEEQELTTAIGKLRNSIAHLNKEARQRLTEAFGIVDAHFRKLFAELFGGGKAYLQLTDDDDLLSAGLEIFAQPPGKKLQNLTLLSGGEQTLTSIALVFAMFLTNPSPICVLDEIDAALDDANVDRVCNALDKMAAQGDTRFLVISHHRMSVARMDRLYGVTMVQRGISQLVSVDLSQADLLDDHQAVA